MTAPNPALERLRQLLALVAREEFHLLGVRERLFGGLPDDQLTEAWLRQTLATPEGIDRVESFGAKFGRMQDTLVDKLLPALLAVAQAPAPRRRYAACPAHCASAGSRQPNPTHTSAHPPTPSSMSRPVRDVCRRSNGSPPALSPNYLTC